MTTAAAIGCATASQSRGVAPDRPRKPGDFRQARRPFGLRSTLNRPLRNPRTNSGCVNYFRAKKQFSSSVIEGLNNEAKVTLRNAYGYRTFGIAELSLYHLLGKLPEPKPAHRFF